MGRGQHLYAKRRNGDVAGKVRESKDSERDRKQRHRAHCKNFFLEALHAFSISAMVDAMSLCSKYSMGEKYQREGQAHISEIRMSRGVIDDDSDVDLPSGSAGTQSAPGPEQLHMSSSSSSLTDNHLPLPEYPGSISAPSAPEHAEHQVSSLSSGSIAIPQPLTDIPSDFVPHRALNRHHGIGTMTPSPMDLANLQEIIPRLLSWETDTGQDWLSIILIISMMKLPPCRNEFLDACTSLDVAIVADAIVTSYEKYEEMPAEERERLNSALHVLSHGPASLMAMFNLTSNDRASSLRAISRYMSPTLTNHVRQAVKYASTWDLWRTLQWVDDFMYALNLVKPAGIGGGTYNPRFLSRGILFSAGGGVEDATKWCQMPGPLQRGKAREVFSGPRVAASAVEYQGPLLMIEVNI